MDDDERQRLTRAARDHRSRAAGAREEAVARGPGWWGYHMLQQSADYYDRRARDAERQLRRLQDLGSADATPGGEHA